MGTIYDLRAFETIVQNSTHIYCVCHKNPDGDAIGSVLGLQSLLSDAFPHITVTAHCIDKAPAAFAYLHTEFLLGIPNPKKGETIIYVDTAAKDQSGFLTTNPELFSKDFLTICIDHHVSNTGFGEINIIDSTKASACEIIFAIAMQLHWIVSSYTAQCLHTGLLTDTGGYLHSNTTSETYRTAAALMRHNSNSDVIIKDVFKTIQLSTLRLWGRVLEKISITETGAAIAAVTAGDFKLTGAHHSELAGAIDYVNSIPGMRFSMILSERDGKVKGSLRTLRDDIDVAKMAGQLEGGGHSKAAGFSVSGMLKKQTQWSVVPSM